MESSFTDWNSEAPPPTAGNGLTLSQLANFPPEAQQQAISALVAALSQHQSLPVTQNLLWLTPAGSQVSLVSSAIAGSQASQQIVPLGDQEIVQPGVPAIVQPGVPAIVQPGVPAIVLPVVPAIVEPGAHAGTNQPPNITDVRRYDRTAFVLVIRTLDMVVECTFRAGRGAFFDVEDTTAFREMVREILEDIFHAYIEIYSPHPNAPMPRNVFSRERLAMIGWGRLSSLRYKFRNEALRLTEPDAPTPDPTPEDRERAYQILALDEAGQHPSNELMAHRVTRQTTNNRFLHSGALSDEDEIDDDYRFPLVLRLVRNVCYRGPATPTSTHRSFVQGIRYVIQALEWEFPEDEEAAFLTNFCDEIYALAATALRFALDLRSGGEWVTRSFRQTEYSYIYRTIRDAISLKRAISTAWSDEFDAFIEDEVAQWIAAAGPPA